MTIVCNLHNGLFQELVSTSTLFNDGDWVESKDQDQDGSVRLIQLADIGDGKFLNKSKRFMNIETAKKLNCTFLKKNDILIARMPDPLGRCCLFPFDENEKYVTVVDIAILRIKSDYSNSYIQYIINTSQVRHAIEGQITGTTRKRITRKKLENLKIPLPPLPEQQKIAAILDAADQLRQKDQQLIEKYTALSQSLFLDMFGDPKLNPKKWKLSYLHEVIEDGPQNGLYKPSKDYGSGAPIIRIDSFHNSIVETKSLKRVNINETELSNFEIFENDFVINRVNSPSHLGKCGLVPKINERMVYESNMMRVKFNTKKTNIVFMLSILSSQYLKNQILNSSKDAVNQSSINQKDVNNFTIPLPPINLQNQFAERIQAIESQKQQAQASLQKSEDLFNSLLQRAFKGELTA